MLMSSRLCLDLALRREGKSCCTGLPFLLPKYVTILPHHFAEISYCICRTIQRYEAFHQLSLSLLLCTIRFATSNRSCADSHCGLRLHTSFNNIEWTG